MPTTTGCSTSGARRIALASSRAQLAWFRDPHDAADDIRRNAARGVRAVSFSENPAGFHVLGLLDDRHVMVETDFPHMDSTRPAARR